MNQFRKICLFVLVFFVSGISAFAFPEYLAAYRGDPFRNPNVDGCATCHMSPQGGDARNDFGSAFEGAGAKFTPMIRAQFPEKFNYPTAKVGDMVVIHFCDPDKKQIVIEAGGKKTLVDVDKKTVDGKEATTPGGGQAAAPAVSRAGATPAAIASPARREGSEVRVDEYAREGAFFGSTVVNLPDGKPIRAGGFDFFVGHRFGQDIRAAGFGGLFGFDSAATVAFGGRVGVTDRISVGLLRSNWFQTIELSSAFQISRQNGETPITLQVRGGVDGQYNFGLHVRPNRTAPPRQFSPFIQAVTTRTFSDRVSFTVIPTFAFNTRNENDPNVSFRGFNTGFNNTISLGLGTGVRFLPSVSLVGEFIPRLYGFRGVRKDRPGVSVGLQKSTYRHTFELIVTRQEPMTTAHYATQGTDTFRIGFNIYRKLR